MNLKTSLCVAHRLSSLTLHPLHYSAPLYKGRTDPGPSMGVLCRRPDPPLVCSASAFNFAAHCRNLYLAQNAIAGTFPSASVLVNLPSLQ